MPLLKLRLYHHVMSCLKRDQIYPTGKWYYATGILYFYDFTQWWKLPSHLPSRRWGFLVCSILEILLQFCCFPCHWLLFRDIDLCSEWRFKLCETYGFISSFRNYCNPLSLTVIQHAYKMIYFLTQRVIGPEILLTIRLLLAFDKCFILWKISFMW